jgi:hypothetical protein
LPVSCRPNPVPSYRLHKQSGQAIVTLRDPITGRRRDVLLGAFDTPASRAEYARVITEWEVGGRVPPRTTPVADLTVNELLALFTRHARQHYRHPDGTLTSEFRLYAHALGHVTDLYGHPPAAEFGPLALKAVRARMVAAKWCRAVVNRAVGRIVRVWKWGTAEELVPATVYQALRTVAGLQPGRTEAQEREPVKPPPVGAVEATLPHLNRQVAAMVRRNRPLYLCTHFLRAPHRQAARLNSRSAAAIISRSVTPGR